MLNQQTSQFAEANGAWTAMAIKLPDGSYTREPKPDYRLKRLLQVAADVSKKPIAECRVLDLACLEGHYAIEFAMHGAEALGTEGRAVSVAKCDYARDALGLDRLRFVEDDVRNFSVEKYGRFDIIICSGLLYHLTADAGAALIRELYRACDGIMLLDTFISLYGKEQVTVAAGTVQGHYYHEHFAKDDKAAKLWASLDNERSFWFTEASLVNLLVGAGFTSVADVLAPTAPSLADRKTYLAVAGKPAEVRTSDPTAALAPFRVPEGPNTNMDGSQHRRSALHRTAKALLPQGIKDAIKPPLRALGILPPDPTPEFMRKKKR